MTNTNPKNISNKLRLLNLAEELSNISKACSSMGFSRDAFYRYKNAYENGGINALFEQSRSKANVKKRVDEQVE